MRPRKNLTSRRIDEAMRWREAICSEVDIASMREISGLIINGESEDLINVLMLVITLDHTLDVMFVDDVLVMMVVCGADLVQSSCPIASHSSSKPINDSP